MNCVELMDRKLSNTGQIWGGKGFWANYVVVFQEGAAACRLPSPRSPSPSPQWMSECSLLPDDSYDSQQVAMPQQRMNRL